MSNHQRFGKPRARRGLTLIEILVAAAIAIIVLLAVVEMFKHAAASISDGRAEIEMAAQVRRVAAQLRQDLSRITVPTRPWPSDTSSDGYFEIIEGRAWDGMNMVTVWPAPPDPTLRPGDPLVTAGDPPQFDDARGDIDDILMFTAYSPGRPFVGQFVDRSSGSPVIRTIESHWAEIVWWARLNNRPTVPTGGADWPLWNPRTESYSLYRRVLLIRPDLAMTNWPSGTPHQRNQFFNENDISARVNGAGFATNSLADLTKRENRWFHAAGFPHILNTAPFFTTRLDQAVDQPSPGPAAQPIAIKFGNHVGEDVVLPHLLSFDVKVYDPTAPIRGQGGRALEPSDPGYNPADASQTIVGQGAYVDLGYSRYRGGVVAPWGALRFYGAPAAKSQLGGILPTYTFCTWSSHYERDGIDQDSSGLADQGTDGIDNDGTVGVDDGIEQETSPPYPFALRGIEVTIRMADIPSQNVRQMTVRSEFTPE